MTPSELKFEVERAGHDSHFFTRATMKFFGDTMRNYGVRTKPVMVDTWTQGVVECWELYRKRPVKYGLQGSAYFSTATFARILPKREA